MIPQQYLDAVLAQHPCPTESGYERAYWLYEARGAFRWIADFISTEYKRQVAAIQDAGIASELFELVPVERAESRVRTDVLREKYPEMFSGLVFIKATDAARILGRRTLYDLAADAVGTDALREFEQVNVGDVARLMPKSAVSELIDTRMKVLDWVVREKDV